MPMNIDEARVVDPVLTHHARGYRHPEHIGTVLFPFVDVQVRAGHVVEFGKEAFLLYNLRRAPGAATKRILFGYLGKPYRLVQDSVEVPVPRELREDANAVPEVDLGLRAANLAMRTMLLSLEVEQAALATDAGNYDAEHKKDLDDVAAKNWSDAEADPLADIAAAKEVIRATTGVYPNVMTIGAKAWPALKDHPKIVERVKFTSKESVTADIVANLAELERIAIGKAIYADEDEDFHDVWGNTAVLAYAPQAPSAVEEPSFGYTYRMDSHPFIEQPYFEQNPKSWIFGATFERVPLLTGPSAGFLFENVVA